MKTLSYLFEKNKKWAKKKLETNPHIFESTSKKQTPKYLWIGCSDSRVSPSEILQLKPGEIFVHRNIANLFPNNDLNCLSALQYAVEYLSVEHVIVCGHYGCGGVAAAMEPIQYGLIDSWLKNIRDIYSQEKESLDAIKDETEKYKKLIELNVRQQAYNICHTTIVQNSWNENKYLSVHGWVYDISSGLLKDLNCTLSSLDDVESVYRTSF